MSNLNDAREVLNMRTVAGCFKGVAAGFSAETENTISVDALVRRAREKLSNVTSVESPRVQLMDSDTEGLQALFKTIAPSTFTAEERLVNRDPDALANDRAGEIARRAVTSGLLKPPLRHG